MEATLKKRPGYEVKIIKGAAAPQPLLKSDKTEQFDSATAVSASEWITPDFELQGLKKFVLNSSILPQCIRAYKNNIAGFGIGLRYKVDEEETSEMAAEYAQAEEIIDLLNYDCDATEIFKDIIDGRETYGIAYLECIRNLEGNVAQIEYVKDIPSVQKTRLLEPYISTEFNYKGKVVKRDRKFRKYRQTVGSKTVYFKEFGDPRIMNKYSGDYLADGEKLDLKDQANELLEFALGTEPYGEVRWAGQILGVDGSRRAEELNNNYFRNGRHTPLMIILKGGTLTEDSFTKLTEYMNDIKGEAGQHAFIVLETESSDNAAVFEGEKPAEVEIKDLASILQKDELFQEYLDNNRRRAQSAFNLPDLYVGYTTDFNRATAQTAQEITEKQVFQPERKSLAWIINNRLLNGYNFRFVEVYFKEPKTTNPDDMFKILTIAEKAGGLTPNKAKEIAYSALGDDFEEFEGEWGNTPLVVANAQNAAQNMSMPMVVGQLEKKIAKAAAAKDDSVVAVMKEVRSLLLKMREEGK